MMSESQSNYAAQLDSAPARFLDQFEELRMNLSNEQLVAEAIEINHAGVGKERTRDRYRDHLIHFGQYLASAHGATFYTAKRKHVWSVHEPSRKGWRGVPTPLAAQP
jgi:hypothetical protein